MSRYTADSKDRVLTAVDMLALISTRTELRRAGVNSYFGCCPFHDERTGSFHVRPEEKHYHCFGCQESGDPFDFVMQTEGLDFKAAMESLADRFGVTLETEDEDPGAAARRQRRERLHSLLDRVATYYARYLWEAGEAQTAREYLRGARPDRGDAQGVPGRLRAQRLGPRAARVAAGRLLRRGAAGHRPGPALAQRPGSIYDRFRGRIMFPAPTHAAACTASAPAGCARTRPARSTSTPPTASSTTSARSCSGSTWRAPPPPRPGAMILVEGYTDVLALHQAGIRNAVGIMGTSLTEEQIRELERVVKILELCLDADRAGQEAMLRASRLAAGRDLELRVVPLPEGTDPADLIERDGAEALRALVQSSTPFVVFNVERILERADTRSAEGRDRALSELRPVLNDLGASVLRDDLVRRVAGRLELTEGRLATVLAGGGSAGGVPRPGRPGNGAGPGGPAGTEAAIGPGQAVRGERLFLALCLAVPDVGATILANLDIDGILTSTALRRAARHLTDHLRTPLAGLPDDDEEFARTISGLVELAGRVPDPSADRLEHARLILDLDRLERAIIRARAAGGGTSELAHQREVVRDAMREAVARLEDTL